MVTVTASRVSARRVRAWGSYVSVMRLALRRQAISAPPVAGAGCAVPGFPGPASWMSRAGMWGRIWSSRIYRFRGRAGSGRVALVWPCRHR